MLCSLIGVSEGICLIEQEAAPEHPSEENPIPEVRRSPASRDEAGLSEAQV